VGPVCRVKLGGKTARWCIRGMRLAEGPVKTCDTLIPEECWS